MEREWLYLINPILTATTGSNILGIRISNAHNGRLANNEDNPFIASLHATYNPIHKAYTDAFSFHKHKVGLQISITKTFILLLEKLSFEKINAFDASIAVVHHKGSSKYIALLSKGHYPFQQGTQEERIAAVEALSIGLSEYEELGALKETVDAFILELRIADTAQKAAFNAVVLAANALELARVAMAEEQYSNLGKLMSHFKTNPKLAAAYFDLQAIRRGKQILFQKNINKNSTKFIVKRTMDANAELTLSNSGNSVLFI